MKLKMMNDPAKIVASVALVSLATLLNKHVLSAQAAAPEILWQKDFGGSGDDTLNVIKATRDGGVILGGYSNSGISGNKTNAGFGDYDF